MLWPRPLTSGALGVFAPSGPFDPERFAAGVARLAARGMEVRLHRDVGARHGFLAGDDATRTAALHDLLADPGVEALIAARGGYGAHRILEAVDPARLRLAAKPLVGFSDVTALHALGQRHAGLVSFHGPVVTQLADLGDGDLDLLVDTLRHPRAARTLRADGPVLAPGRAAGRLAGGCLSVLAPLVGTRFLDLPEGALLLLEDVGEAPYRVDRLLTHLRLAGVFDRVGGVVLGDFVGCVAPRPGEPTVEEVLAERLGDLGVPVRAGFPVGHGRRNGTLPLGAWAELDADAGTLRTAPEVDP